MTLVDHLNAAIELAEGDVKVALEEILAQVEGGEVQSAAKTGGGGRTQP